MEVHYLGVSGLGGPVIGASLCIRSIQGLVFGVRFLFERLCKMGIPIFVHVESTYAQFDSSELLPLEHAQK